MCFCILIALFIRSELSFDHFQKHENRIAAIGVDARYFGKSLYAPYPMAGALKKDVPEVENAVRVKPTSKLRLSRDGRVFIQTQKKAIYTEPAFFDIFSFPLINGNPSYALSDPRGIVLTQRVSKQLFGDADPVGRTVYWQKDDTVITMNVTGVVGDVPHNSTLQFGALISMSTLPASYRPENGWGMDSFQTYALLRSPTDQSVLPGRLKQMAKTYITDEGPARKEPYFFSIPLNQLHLSKLTRDDGFSGSWRYLYLFGSIALFLLIIACVNYINLATARSTMRSHEIGVRKVLGAGKMQVAVQFLGESVMLSIMAYLVGIALASVILPFFNSIFGTVFTLSHHVDFLGIMMLGAVLVGLISGSYPALFLSAFSPTTTLRNNQTSGLSPALLRKILITFQFTIALVLIVGVLVIFRQLRYTQTANLGFDPHRVATFELSTRLWEKREELRHDLIMIPGIQDVSIDMGAPADFHVTFGLKPSQISPDANVNNDNTNIDFLPAVIDYHFLSLLHIKLLTGRNFSRKINSDKAHAYIINKKFAANLGWTPKQAIGKTIKIGPNTGKVIGVTENFHITSMYNAIKPVLLGAGESRSWSFRGILMARLAPGHFSTAIKTIKKKLKNADHNYYGNYEFMDQTYAAMYRTDRRLGDIMVLFTLIAIIVACMGLYGLATFAAGQRTKEIGIRKVLGASITGIVTLLSIDFLKLVGIGFLIAVPIAWYVMHRWLENFAYHINIGIGTFVLAGGIATLIALATVSWQSIKAAMANPVNSLRNE